MRRIGQAAAILGALYVASSALAQSTVNINLGAGTAAVNYTGLAAAPDAAAEAAIWSQVSNAAAFAGVIGLQDSFGAPTSLGLAVDSQPGQFRRAAGGDFETMVAANLMRSYFFTTAARNFTLSGLLDSTTYDLYLYGQADSASETGTGGVNGQNSVFTLGGVSKTTSYDGVIGGDGLLAEGKEYVLFSGVAPVNGQIDFSWMGDGGLGGFNGLQIVGQIPPPATALDLVINTTTGEVKIVNNNVTSVLLDGYEIGSTASSLSTAYSSLSDQAIDAGSYMAGDFNVDGAVNAADYTVWRDNQGGNAANLNGNGNGDALVNGVDYSLWSSNYGSSVATPYGWDEVGGSSSNLLAEFYLGAGPFNATSLAPGEELSLGSAFTLGASDASLTFRYNDAGANELVTGNVVFTSGSPTAIPEPGVLGMTLLLIVSVTGFIRR